MAHKSELTMIAVGDVSPSRDDPPSIFRHCGDTFRNADVVFGQMESPMSARGSAAFVPHSPVKIAPDNISALDDKTGVGFDVMSFACNHAMDYGWDAFYDTFDHLQKAGIAVVGAGKNMADARAPVIIERNGTKIGFLGYLSIVFPGVVAEDDMPGCAPLRASTEYRQVDFQPGTPPLIITRLYPEDRAAMEEDVRKLREQVDVLVVSMHCGVHVVPTMIADYQKEAAYAAIDAGADVVLQHHSHILKGMEFYQGKPIFYSLNNFALDYNRLKPNPHKAWDLGYRKLFHDFYKVKVHPGYEKHRFHFDALKTVAAKIYVKDKKLDKVTFLPTYVNPDLEPEVLGRSDPRAQEVFDYVQMISEEVDMNVQLAWEGDEVRITPKRSQPGAHG